jgi:hypothetical protein
VAYHSGTWGQSAVTFVPLRIAFRICLLNPGVPGRSEACRSETGQSAVTFVPQLCGGGPNRTGAKRRLPILRGLVLGPRDWHGGLRAMATVAFRFYWDGCTGDLASEGVRGVSGPRAAVRAGCLHRMAAFGPGPMPGPGKRRAATRGRGQSCGLVSIRAGLRRARQGRVMLTGFIRTARASCPMAADFGGRMGRQSLARLPGVAIGRLYSLGAWSAVIPSR